MISRTDFIMRRQWTLKIPQVPPRRVVDRAPAASRPSQLETALERQKTQKLPLGQLLVKLGFISDDAMRMALASQVGVPFIDLDNTSIDPGLGRVLNKNFARRHVLVPVAQQGRTLTIAMDDPTKRALVDDITRMTGLTVTVVTSSNLGLQRALKRLYDDESGPVESGPAEPAGPKGSGKPMAGSDARFQTHPCSTTRSASGRTSCFSRCWSRRSRAGAATSIWKCCQSGLHVRFRVDGVLRAAGFRAGPAGAEPGDARDRVAHQDSGQARHRRAPPAAGRQLPVRHRTRRGEIRQWICASR